MDKRLLQISAVGAYTNLTDADPAKRAGQHSDRPQRHRRGQSAGRQRHHHARGPAPERQRQIQDHRGRLRSRCFRPCWNTPAEKGVSLALENWTATNIQNLAHWQRLFEVLPQNNLGLNFDPSHLLWQDIDYIEAVDKFADRIFHTHGKDTEVKTHVKRIVGNQGSGWWRYVIPGLGQIRWGEYIAALRRNGYNGVISIEHEDDAVEREEGFLIGKKYLEQFIAY